MPNNELDFDFKMDKLKEECGIFGIFGFNDSVGSRSNNRSMTNRRCGSRVSSRNDVRKRKRYKSRYDDENSFYHNIYPCLRDVCIIMQTLC